MVHLSMVIKLIEKISLILLHEWGEDKDKRFIVLHHSILSEGINVQGLEAALFLRIWIILVFLKQ